MLPACADLVCDVAEDPPEGSTGCADKQSQECRKETSITVGEGQGRPQDSTVGPVDPCSDVYMGVVLERHDPTTATTKVSSSQKTELLRGRKSVKTNGFELGRRN